MHGVGHWNIPTGLAGLNHPHGTTWTYATVPAAMTAGSGPNSVVVTNDGNHEIFVAAMWNTGIWRYVEP